MADDTDAAKRALLEEIDECLERAFRRIGKGSGRIIERLDAYAAAVRAEQTPPPKRICPWCFEPCAQTWCGRCERMLPVTS